MDNAKLQQLLDESDLTKLIRELPRALDTRDWGALGRLYVEDGVLDLMGRETVGRDAIVAAAERDLEKNYEATYHHLGNNIYIDLDGDNAKVVAYCVAYHLPKKSEVMKHSDGGGIYHVDAVRTAEGWRFKRLKLRAVWWGGIPIAFGR